jgi:hypothetical protein
MASNWGPTEHPMEHDHLEDGPDVCMGTPDHELNEYHYDATDARQNDSAANKWVKVDHCSGAAGANGDATGGFPDGPGPWKQT